MMIQDFFPFHYTTDQSNSGMTSFAGLPLYLEMALISGLSSEITKTLNSKIRGWSDLQIILSLILLNLAGGESVDDIERLESDPGMRTLFLKLQNHRLKRKARRDLQHRWRTKNERAFPSPSAIHRYLEQFHHASEEKNRTKSHAFIPANNALLDALMNLNKQLARFAQIKSPVKTATLDQDATLVATNKTNSLYCYKNHKAYHPFNTYWFEQDLVLHSEFRDGNVVAGFEQLRLLESSLNALPEGVEKVYLRSDSAGYQWKLLQYCAQGKNERFGVIEFAISANVTQAFKTAALELEESSWHSLYKKGPNGEPIKTDQEWAEVCFVPRQAVCSKKYPDYRYLAIRERMSVQRELEFDGEVGKQMELPFQTIASENGNYKLFGIVTNRTLPGDELIHWHRERCGQSEKIYSVEKSDLAGGRLPSNKFGANAAWWQIMVLSLNVNSLMKKLVMPEALRSKRLKGLRFQCIGVAGRLVRHARGIWIRLSGGAEMVELFEDMRKKIIALAQSPPALEAT